ncbi:dihydrofolate reductase family protein [Brevundimonas lenta]|uniref:Dihydrofolate reductase n=1 Tax=Brevundimonas lenta TaxID=424796 RepID=A0A7W6JD81_9CAUL|nr:dihydrofolate reductase family protein [Brevundimonas lenta]MBB4082990.1 dihydrofolate reductase [Brevundimonas lenta]
MRKVTVAAMVSIDGVMQAPGGPDEDPTGGFAFGGWVWPWFDETGGDLMDHAMGQDYDLLLGRRTYEIFAAYWPGKDDAIGRKFDAITKYVAASPETPMTWKGSVRLEGDVADAVERLKAEDGPDLLIQGSSEVVHALLARNLIDRISLLTFPVILGTGKRFFDQTSAPAAFALTETRRSPSGVVVNRYERDGEVPVGSFGDDTPSALELERRERWAREG